MVTMQIRQGAGKTLGEKTGGREDSLSPIEFWNFWPPDLQHHNNQLGPREHFPVFPVKICALQNVNLPE